MKLFGIKIRSVLPFALAAVIFLLLVQGALAAARSTPFGIGETLDPGADGEPCGPLDDNCFPALFSTNDEGVRLSSNVLNLDFVGAGVTATHSGATTTISIAGGSGSLTGTAGQTLYFSGTDTPTATSTLFLASTGRVAIGTTTPSSKFHVYNGSSAEPLALFEAGTLAAGGDASIRLLGGGTGNPEEVYIEFADRSDPTNSFTIGLDDDAGKLNFGYGALGTMNGHSRMTLSSSGNLGIGTTSPFARLSVGGNAYIGGTLTATGTVTFTGLTNVLLATNADGTLISTTTIGANLIDTTGDWTGTFDGQEGSYYLGNSFSTTSADYWETQQTARTADDLTNNSIEDLSDVATMTKNYGDLLFWNGSAWSDMATSSLGLATAFTATYPIQYSGNVLSLAFGTTTANSWSALQTFNGNASSSQLTTTGSTYLATLGGNVGIGTANPLAALDVRGDMYLGYDQAATSSILKAFSSAHSASNVPAEIRIGIEDAIFSGFSVVNTRSSSFNSQYLTFSTVNGGVDGGIRMVVGANGNVGIGTTTPAHKLDIYTDSTDDPARITNANANGAAGIRFDNNSGTFGYIGHGGTGASAAFADRAFLYTFSGEGTSLVAFNGDHRFYTGGVDDESEKMRITSAGNLGIGTSSPYAKLSVVGPVVAEYFHATSTSATSTFGGGLSAASNFYVLQNGKVGIGTATPGADYWLEAYPGVTGQAIIGRTAIGGWSGDGGFGSIGYRGANYNTNYALRYSATDTYLNADSGSIYFSNGNTPQGVITAAGNFGIGTTSPYAKLSVVGNVAAANFTATTTAVNTFPTLLSTSASTTNFAITGLTNVLLATNADGTLISTTTIGANLVDTSGTWSGNAATASALAANGANCSAGSAALGVDASGAAEGCFDVWTEAENTSAAYIALTDLSSSATGLTYNNGTGAFTLTSGYTIPLSASTTEWDTAYSWGDHSSEGYLTDITGENIDDLLDVNTTGVAAGDVLYYTGSGWATTATSSWSSGAGTNFWSETTSFGQKLTYLTDTTSDVLFGGTSTSTAAFWFDVSASTTHFGGGGSGDSTLQFDLAGVAKWVFGVDDSNEDRFVLASGDTLGTNDRLVVDAAGNVGIGTSSPYARLSVAGPVVAEYFTATSSTATSTFEGGFSAASSLYALQGGKVGIGTAAPDELLHVTGVTGQPTVLIDSPFGNQALLRFKTGGTNTWTVGHDPSIDYNLIFSEGGTLSNNPIFTIATAGKVGVGTTTPWKDLSVDGDLSLTGALFDSAASAGTNGYVLQSTGAGTTWVATSSLGIVGGEGGGGSGTVNSGNSGYFAYYPSTGTTVDDQTMLNISGSNIGIGTTTPGTRFAITGGGTGTGRAFTIADSSNSDKFWFQDNGKSYFAGGIALGDALPTDSNTRILNAIVNGGNTQGIFIQNESTGSGASAAYTAKNSLGSGLLLGQSSTGSTGTYGASASYLEAEQSGGLTLGATHGSGIVRFFSGGTNERMRIAADGLVGIGTTSPVSTLSVQGSLCVRDTGSCGTTAGTIYATTATLSDIDLAENYRATDETLEAGEIVSLDTTATGTIKRAEQGETILGVISTKPGLLLGQDIKDGKPVALKGRIPVKVSMEGGPIAVGDAIMLSSEAGVGMRASSTAFAIGFALDAIEEDGLVEVFVQNQTYFTDGDRIALDALIGLGLSSSTPPQSSDDFLDVFFENVFARLTQWFASATNGIESFFAREIHTERICLTRSDGGEVCVTGDELEAAVGGTVYTPSPEEPFEEGGGEDSEVQTGEGEEGVDDGDVPADGISPDEGLTDDSQNDGEGENIQNQDADENPDDPSDPDSDAVDTPEEPEEPDAPTEPESPSEPEAPTE